jgi:DNA-binding NtrC family response regulator
VNAIVRLPTFLNDSELFPISHVFHRYKCSTTRTSAGNNAEAARRLGIHRRLLYEKMKRFGLAFHDKEQDGDN